MNVVAIQVSKEQEEILLDLTSKVYKVVVEHGKEGVLQSELWKELTLTSRDGSRLAIRLERRGMIRRDKLLEEGRWTYKLTALRMPVHIESIEDAPCITCPYENKCSPTGIVSPLSCPWLLEWVTKEYSEMTRPEAPILKKQISARIVKSPVAASRVK